MTAAFFVLLVLAASPLDAEPAALAAPVTVRVHPATPWLEPHPAGTQLNCDFVVTSKSEAPLTIREIELSVLSPTGALVSRRFLSTNGTRGSIDTIGPRLVAPGSFLVVFNPFYDWPEGVLPATLRYTFTLRGEGEGAKDTTASVTFKPAAFPQAVALVPPLEGRFIVWDGHDYFSHHRRWDVGHPLLRQLGFQNNAARYAYDFSVVNEAGDLYRGKGEKPEDWFGFGTEVVAPGDGIVVEAAGHFPDRGDNKLDLSQIATNPRIIGGNYVAIDHGKDEVSMLYHLQQGSVTVKPGDRVRQGQRVGRMGMSGDAFTVHVHYQLQRGLAFDVEGLPSLFSDVRRVRGRKTESVVRGVVDTGDILVR